MIFLELFRGHRLFFSNVLRYLERLILCASKNVHAVTLVNSVTKNGRLQFYTLPVGRI